MLLEVAHDRAVDVGARRPRPDRGEGGLLRGDGVLEQPLLLVGRRADDHPALELGVVAPDRRARLGHEHVAGAELDRVRDRVRPRAADADLAAVAGRCAVRGREPSDLAARGEHGERRLVSGAQRRFRLGRAGAGVLLQQPVGVRAPAAALADERDLALALAHEHRLDRVAERRDARTRDRAQRGALVAEDPGIAVAVGADRALDPEIGQHPRETEHRVLEPRVLRVRLDPLERGLGPRALDLELRHEDRRLAAGALRVHDRPLVREEPEAGEVLDVVGAEEDVPGQARAAHVLEQPSAPSSSSAGEMPSTARSVATRAARLRAQSRAPASSGARSRPRSTPRARACCAGPARLRSARRRIPRRRPRW